MRPRGYTAISIIAALALVFVAIFAGTIWMKPGTSSAQGTTPTVVFTPTITCTPTVDNGCPIAQAVAPGNAFNSYTFVAGSIYHMNLSLEGASAGIEGNLLFKATTTFTANFDGAAWLYSGMITSPTCQFCDETKGDYVLTLADVPQLTGLIEVLNSPCTTGAGSTTLPVHKLEVQ